MNRSITLMGVLVAGVLVAGAGQASAQGQAPLERGFVHVNFGGQGGTHDLAQSGTFPIYGEEALLTGTTEAGGGSVFDIGGGFRVYDKFYAGLSYSYSSDKSDGAITGSIPHPLYTDTFRPVTGSVTGLKHAESAIHLQAVWKQPVTTKFDISLSAGPTIFMVDQDLVSSLTVTEQGTGVVLTGIQTEKVSETAIGFHIGADGTYMFTSRLGAGGFLRYTGGSADLEAPTGNVEVDLGGFQIGAGLRLRF
jgi:hypothetical protein